MSVQQGTPRTIQEIAAEAQAKLDAEDAAATEGGAPEAAEAAEESPPEPKPRRRTVENKPAGETAAEREKRLAELRPELEKLGLKVEAGEVTVKERAALRAERRKAEEKLSAAKAQVEERIAQFEREASTYGKLKQVISSRDIEAMARLMGFESFGKMATEYATVGNDPALREAREAKAQLEAMRAEREAERRAAQEAAERAASEEKTRAAREQYQQEMVATLEAHEVPEIRALAANPEFQHYVYLVQQDSYRQSGGATFLDTADAAELAFEKTRASFESLLPVFQAKAPERPSAGSRTVGERRKPTVVTQQTATEASGASSRPLSKEEWIRKHAPSIERAIRAEK